MAAESGRFRLDRAGLLARRRASLVCGRAAKADIWVSEHDGAAVIVKEYDGRRAPAAAWGRLQIRREARLLRAAESAEAAPGLVGLIGRDGLVMEHAKGRPLFEIVEPELRERAVEELESAVARVHSLGIVHMDLRSRDNVLVTADGAVTLLDWASAIRLRPGGLLHRVCFPLLRAIDESAVVKWKDLFAPGKLDARDLRFKRRFLALRVLWPFNRKGLGEVDRRLSGHRTK